MEGVVPSDTESRRFGFSIGRAFGSEALSDALRSVSEGSFEIVIARVPAAADHVLAEALDPPPGGFIYDCGSLVTYEGVTRRSSGRALDAVLHWTPDDTRLVLDIFAGYRNHISGNPLLDPTVVPLGYAEWAEAHLDDDAGGSCFRFNGSSGRAEAFAATAVIDGVMSISLAGVTPHSRGRGVYRGLLDALEEHAFRSGLGRVRIATQIENVTPIRAWVERGWTEVERETVFHVVSGAVHG